LPFYLDDELHGDERAAIEDHVECCAACRTALGREQRFLERIRTARPMYQPPSSLRARVEAITIGKPKSRVSPSRLRRRRAALAEPGSVFPYRLSVTAPRRANRRRRIALVITVAASMIFGTLYLNRHRELLPSRRLSDFSLLAIDTHLRHLRGQLPLEIVTNSPEQISQWFAGKVPFGLRLPTYQELSGQERLYELQGARLVGFNKEYAAYVAYQMRQRLITLVVTSNSAAQPFGRERFQSHGLSFRSDSADGLKVLTWSARGLTYALVSDLPERGQESCLVCHAGTKDRDFIEKLKPIWYW